MSSPSRVSSDQGPVHEMANVKDFDTEELIEYLQRKNLKLKVKMKSPALISRDNFR
ncbi:10273_t:CDS:1, partial [Dentiscutata erythropus]